jgi:hypothetical protein
MLDQQATAGRAGLAGILDDAAYHRLECRLVVGIGEDDLWRLSPQLHGDRHVMHGRGLGHTSAGLGGAGERQMVDLWMGRQGGACLAAQARDDIERPRRQARLRGQLGQAQHAQAGLLRWLEHHGVPCRQCGGDTATEDLGGIVPGDDLGADPIGFAPGHHREVVLEGNRLAVQLVGGAAIEAEVAGTGGDVTTGLGHGLAGIDTLQGSQALVIGLDGRGEGQQPLAAPARAPARPVPQPAGKGITGRPDGLVDLLGLATGDARDGLAPRGGLDLQGLAGGDPFTSDQGLMAGHLG